MFQANFEVASCEFSFATLADQVDVVSLDVAARTFGSRPYPWPIVAQRHEALRPYLATPFKALVNARKYETSSGSEHQLFNMPRIWLPVLPTRSLGSWRESSLVRQSSTLSAA